MNEVRVPDEQEGTKAVVRAWLKKVGETVAVNDPLVELETGELKIVCWQKLFSEQLATLAVTHSQPEPEGITA